MTTRTVRMDRLQEGLVVLAQTLVPSATVLWARSEYPEEVVGPTLVAWKKISGPSSAGEGGEEFSSVTLPMTATLTIDAATVGASALLFASCLRFEYQAQAGDTVTDVRDGLLIEIAAKPYIDVAFTASGADQIMIAAATFGDLYRLSALGLGTLAVDTAVVGQAQIDEVEFAIEVQIYSTNRYLMDGASQAMSDLIGGLRLPEARAVMDEYTFDVMPGNPITLDALAGPVWESREASTFTITMTSLSASTAANPITQVAGTFTARDAPGEITTSVVVLEP